MPIVRLEILEGRPAAVKADLIARVTGAVVEALGVAPEQVRVLLYELPAEHWAVGGQTLAARRAAAAPHEPAGEARHGGGPDDEADPHALTPQRQP